MNHSSTSSETSLVSVCIPAFNCDQYVGATIECLLNQTYKNLEIIVVDDGSTDTTKKVLEKVVDKRFHFLSQLNKGAAAARNLAYEVSKGDFIKFMDADDLINSNCIEEQLSKIYDQRDCIASAKWGRFFSPDAADLTLAPEKIWHDMPAIDWLIESLIDAGSNMVQPGIFLIPRNVVEKAGGWNESLSLIDDFEFMARVLCKSKAVRFCENAVLKYRSGLGNNLSAKKSGSHMTSAFESLTLGISSILATRNDKQSRLACANAYQRWAYQFYPGHPELCALSETEIRKLGGSSINIGGGRKYRLLCRLVGWKKAKKLKIYLKGRA